MRRCLVLPLIAMLAACASAQSAYPSLAIRPAERASGTMQPPPAEPTLTTPPPATLDRVSQLAADARADHQAFVEQVAPPTRDALTGTPLPQRSTPTAVAMTNATPTRLRRDL